MQSPDKAARPETRVTVQPPTQMDFPGPELRVTQLCLASISMQKSLFCSLSGLQPVLEVFPLLTFIATIGTISHRKASRHDLFGNFFWNPSQQTKALSFAYQASAHGSLLYVCLILHGPKMKNSLVLKSCDILKIKLKPKPAILLLLGFVQYLCPSPQRRSKVLPQQEVK